MEWVSVNDRFPDYSGWYLVYSPRSKHQSICFFLDLENTFYRNVSGGRKRQFKTVTHWMYQPEPPKP